MIILLIVLIIVTIICCGLSSKSSFKKVDTKTHNKLYQMMGKLHSILEEHNIEYFIAYGTLLGSVREGKIIDWDDDIDIYMRSSELHKLKRLTPLLTKEGLKLDYRDYIWRVNSGGGGSLQDYPYIDIFEMKEEVQSTKFIYAEKYNRDRWSDSLTIKELYPKRKYVLGDLTLYGPNDYHSILKRLYGDYMVPVYSAPHGD